jgi:glycosyltransferase involved in cell wall biosynthesis
MRVLWLVRNNLTQHPGGDTTQILRTAEALRRRGVTIDLSSEAGADLAEYDLVHLFHLDRLWENAEHCRRVRAAGRPVVLSTIYWPSDEFDRGGRAGFQGWLARRCGSPAYQDLRLFQRYLLHCRQRRVWPRLGLRRFSFGRNVRELLAAVSVILPNSRAEQEQIEIRFGVQRPAVIVPNAADSTVFGPGVGAARSDSPQPGVQSSALHPRGGVLCVGRIEPRKNQLALIQALRGTGIPLTLVGRSGRYSSAYHRRCLRAAGANVCFVAQQPAGELRRYYHAAQVHACVSWYETPGLASLEAALCGCALVVTPGGCTREYFGDDAVYTPPDDPDAIRAAVQQALARGSSAALAARVAREYTWDAAAAATLKAYELALSR